MQSLAEELREDVRRPQIHLTTIYPFIVDTGQVQRPRLRFPRLLGVQRSSHAAGQIIRAIRRNQREASIPAWLLPLHNMARWWGDTSQLVRDDSNIRISSWIFFNEFLDIVSKEKYKQEFWIFVQSMPEILLH